MPGIQLFGAAMGLLSAMIWGSGDFSGGLATRRGSPYQALALVSLTGLACLLLLTLATGEDWPSGQALAWSAAAGVSGALGIVALYTGLATGAAALVSPTAAVVGTLPPLLVSALLEGPPKLQQWAGFTAGLAGIWLAASGATKDADRSHLRGLALAIFAGLGFGGFFVLIAQVEGSGVFSPLVVAKLSAVIFALAILKIQGRSFLGPRRLPVGMLAGALDAGGNIFYFLATRYTRLDIAAVLASLYPAATVLLSALVLKEKVTTGQKVGVGLCLLAIALITA
jgi:drug/metabolite transporter (DMT)-like permease